MADKVKFTPSQEAVITSSGKTLIVSAGAGSGKTTVLTEKIIRSIRDGEDIDGILVVTFMKAAAQSLKDKLYSAILKACAEAPGDKALLRTLYRVPSARISTIHSFCLDIIRSNFALLSLPPSMRIADSAESDILLGNCLEDCIDDGFETDDADVLLLCDAFGGEKSLNTLQKIITDIYGRYRALPFWKQSVDEAITRESAEAAKPFGETAAYEVIRKTLAEKAEAMYRTCADIYDTVCSCAVSEKQILPFEYVVEYLEILKDTANDKNAGYTKLREAVTGYKPPRSNVNGLPDEVRKAVADARAAVSSAYKRLLPPFSATEEEAAEDYVAVTEINRALYRVIIKLDTAFSDAKKKNGILDYSDLEQYALELLGERTPTGVVRTPLCKELRGEFTHIYIDEYQDINPLQDTLFRLISKEGNRFMVGDAKQSVYRFRNASAAIFLGYLKDFPAIDEAGNKTEAKAYLPENFRSKKPILDFVNLIFDRLYTPRNVGASYENERLKLPEGKDGSGDAVTVRLFDDGETPHNEAEAAYVANEILKLKDSGYGFGDVAVILRSDSSSGPFYERAFFERGIPYYFEKQNDFLYEPEILLALSLLRIIDDVRNDVSMVGALRSPVFRFSADDIYSIKRYYGCQSLCECARMCARDYERHANPKRYRADKDYRTVTRVKHCVNVRSASEGSIPAPEVQRKCSDFLRLLGELRYASAESSGSGIIWSMYMKTGLVPLCAAEKPQAASNLYTLYQYALDFERSSFKGLSSFLAYIERIADKYGKAISAESDKAGKVSIVSIHKSKGLEYPVCFVSSLGKQFNEDDLKKKYILRADGFAAVNLRAGLSEYRPTVMAAAVAGEKSEMRAEEMRCLYVALTRAQSKLYVTGYVPGCSEGEAPCKGFAEAQSFMDWIYPVVSSVTDTCFNLSVDDSTVPAGKRSGTAQPRDIYPDSVFRTALDTVCGSPAARVPAKAAVSELRKGILEDDEYTKSVSRSEATRKPRFISAKRSAAEIGTVTHAFMQFADFANTEANGARAEAERLVQKGMISAEDAECINYGAVAQFFGSLLYAEMKRSPRVYRERRFNLIEDSSLVSGVSGEKVMIQGVIDCFFENPDGTYTVVDYKTDRFPRDTDEDTAVRELVKRHGMQINYYCRAVSEILGARVSRAVLYSFSLGRSVEVTPG